MPFGFGAFGPEKFSLPELPESPIGPFGPRYDEPPPQVLPPPRAPIVQKSKVPLSPPQTLKQAASSAPIPEPSSYLRFNDSMDPSMGPMEEFTPGPRQSQQSQDEAYQRYLQGTFGIQEAAEQAKGEAIIKAYKEAGGAASIDFKTGLPKNTADRPYYMDWKAQVDPQSGEQVFVNMHSGEVKRPGFLPSSVPSGEVEKLAGMDTAIEKLGGAIELNRQTQGAATGPLDNALNSAREGRFGDLVPGDIDPRIVKMRQDLRSVFNQIAKARIGSAQTVGEAQRLEAEAANPAINDAAFMLKVQNFFDNIKSERENLAKYRGLGSGQAGGTSFGSPSSGTSLSPPASAQTGASRLELARQKYGY